MGKAFTIAAGLISVIAVTSQVHAAQTVRVNYVCNLGNVAGNLTADITAVSGAAVFGDPTTGQFGGSFGTGEVNYQYGGSLTSSVAYYTFTGTNQFAEFTDHMNNSRFHAQFIPQDQQGQLMMLIVAPETAGREQYMCQKVNGGVAAGGYPMQGYPQQGYLQQNYPY